MIALVYRCGHSAMVSDRATGAPRCHICGETQVRYVTPARAPHFTGTVTGPHADYAPLEPGTVNVAPGGPLRIKTQEPDDAA